MKKQVQQQNRTLRYAVIYTFCPPQCCTSEACIAVVKVLRGHHPSRHFGEFEFCDLQTRFQASKYM